ncbi:hypothetical protein BDW71DRAFT_204780 [Aspergillus fruticulosus]
MVFSSTSKDIYLRLDGDFLFLCATCKVSNDSDQWKHSEIYLDEFLGISSDGKFDITRRMENPYHTIMKPGTLYLKGSVMSLTLIDELGGHELSICLDLLFENSNGTLVWNPPRNDIYSSVVGLKLDPKTAVLSGYCLGNDGKLHYSELPLGDHFANRNGVFFREKNGHFNSDGRAQNIHLDKDWWLVADLKFDNGYWNPQCAIEFAQYVHIEDGKFIMDDPAGLFDLRGPIMRFLEDIPVVGYAIAGIDALEGDEDEAKRAVAECTYSTLITAGAVIGCALTGPIGASIGSAYGTMLGLEARAAIGLSINDPTMRNQVTSISLFSLIAAGASLALALPINMVVGGLTEVLTEGVFEEGLVQRALQTAISKGDEALGMFGLKTVGLDEVKKILGKIVDLIQDDLAQGKSNEEIAADISKLYGDDDSDGVNPLNDVTLAVKQAVATAANKALQDAAREVESAVHEVAHDAAHIAVQEMIQEAVQEVGQEVGQELVGEAGGELSALLDVEDAVRTAVGEWVVKIKMAAQDPVAIGGGQSGDPVQTFLEVMPDIKKAPQAAALFIKAITAPFELELENAKYTAGQPIYGSSQEAALKAAEAAENVRRAASVVRQVATVEEPAAIALAAQQLDKAMQKAVQDAINVIKREAAGEAQDAVQNFKDAVHKVVQKFKDAKQEVQATVQDAVPDIEQTAKGKVQDAANDMAWQEQRGGKLPHEDDLKRAAQGAVQGAMQEARQSIQAIADAALQKALQELQAGQEVRKALQKAARDAVEDELPKIGEAVQDSVGDAAGRAMPPPFENPRGVGPGHTMEPGTLS